MRRGRINYSEAEMAWLEANRMMVISDYRAAFVAEFGRDDVLGDHLNALRKRKGWKVGRDGSRYKGRRKKYSAEEIAFIIDRAEWPRAELHEVFIKRFKHKDLSFEAFFGLCKREGIKTGRTGQFVPGAVPMNKGQKMPDHVRAKCLKTAFRKGNLPHNAKGHGHERIDSKDGYIVMIVDEVNPWTGAATRPVHKHRHLWEKEHGPIPKGHALKCLDGDKTNCDPSNWIAVPRGVLTRLNSRWARMKLHEAPHELKPTILATARVKQAIYEAKKGRRSDPKTLVIPPQS